MYGHSYGSPYVSSVESETSALQTMLIREGVSGGRSSSEGLTTEVPNEEWQDGRWRRRGDVDDLLETVLANGEGDEGGGGRESWGTRFGPVGRREFWMDRTKGKTVPGEKRVIHYIFHTCLRWLTFLDVFYKRQNVVTVSRRYVTFDFVVSYRTWQRLRVTRRVNYKTKNVKFDVVPR